MEINNFNDWGFTEVEYVEQPERYLKAAKEILDKFNVKWCFSFGTAIGFYRDGDFPQKDSDVDINVYADDLGDIYDIEDEFEKKYTLIRTVTVDGKRQQAAYQGEDDFIIDLSFYYKDGDNWVSQHEEGKFIDKIDVIGNPRMIETKYGAYPFPEKTEDYLEARYGDWKTPRYGSINSSIRN